MNKINGNYLTKQSKYNCSATLRNSTILWNPNVHYPVDNSPLVVSVKSHINAHHTFQFYNSYLRVICIFPPTLVSQMAPFKSPPPPPNKASINLFYPNTCQITRPSTPILPATKIMNPSIMRRSSASCYFLQPPVTFFSLLLLPPSDADNDNDDKRGPSKWC